jgi:type 1 glutamine amidotransferase
MLIAEQEYQTNESLPAFAAERLTDCRTTFVFEDASDRNRLDGIEAIDSADVLVISVRRRTLPSEQLDRIRRYVASGKPVIGIRTASHAFSLRNAGPPEGRAVWPEFDRQVFGGNYTNHYGDKLKVTIKVAENLPARSARLIEGIPSRKTFPSGGSLYRVSPLADGAIVLLYGEVPGHASEPVAWVFRRGDGGKSFYTSLGHPEDFKRSVLPQLLANAIDWSLER